MQAATNSLSKGERENLPNKLSEALYKDIKSSAGQNWQTIAKALTSSKPFNMTKQEWDTFRKFITSFPKASAPQIAKAIAKVAKTDQRPEAIISFNAEPLLAALINCYYCKADPAALHQNDIKLLKRLSHDLASRERGQIPYYYVHGILPVPDGRKTSNQYCIR